MMFWVLPMLTKWLLRLASSCLPEPVELLAELRPKSLTSDAIEKVIDFSVSLGNMK